VGDNYQIAAELIVPLNREAGRNVGVMVEAAAVYGLCRAEPFRQTRFHGLVMTGTHPRD
jgi:hypothetical protein